MSEILFLAHRIPFPPNRGDKMRSFHILRHLSGFAKVHLGCFADDAAEAARVDGLRRAIGPQLGETLAEPVEGSPLRWAAHALKHGEPINLAAFHSAAMHDFVRQMLARPQVTAVYAFSVQMAQFVPNGVRQRFVMDFVDFDSAKYADYARGLPTPRRLLYRREAPLLRAHERATAERADLSLFISHAEADLFARQAQPRNAHLRVLANGIDLEFYDPGARHEAPRPGPLIAFTGQMDYPPNVEAVVDFAERSLPLIRARRPEFRFAIVGRNPDPAVLRLAGHEGVIVTGEVPDVRPWLAAAEVVVAPLKIARGVQNKVLEAMAMARPVVASAAAFTGIDAEPGRDLIVADGAVAQAEAVLTLLDEPARASQLGRAARLRMEQAYSWEAKLAPVARMVGLSPVEAAA